MTAHTPVCPIAGMENEEKGWYGIQAHPEVLHTQEGSKMLHNFVYSVCHCAGDWKMDAFVEKSIEEIRKKVGNGRALLALSGGVDSSVAGVLMAKAIGDQLTCVFVDHGLLRKNEGDEVEAVFGPNGPYKLNFIRVNAQQRFYDKLAGVTDPERKRKIIGEEFIRVFEEEAKKIGKVDYFVQGTIYPDVIESGLGKSAVIKSHHNVGGLPEHVDFKEIIEPLRMLFKDEVRRAGLELGIPENLVYRQPFPGPGLGVRIIGEVTAEKVRIVQDADAIYREEIAKAGIDRTLGQYFAALTNMRSVGVMGDERTYDYAVALRAVNTIDFMTAEAAEIPRKYWGTLQRGEIVEEDGRILTPDMVLGPARKGLKITYATDTRPTESILENAKHADLFICEGMYGEKDKLKKAKEYKHMTFYEAAELAKAAEVKEMWLTHYSPSLNRPEEYLKDTQDIFENTVASRDGQSVELVFEEA